MQKLKKQQSGDDNAFIFDRSQRRLTDIAVSLHYCCLNIAQNKQTIFRLLTYLSPEDRDVVEIIFAKLFKHKGRSWASLRVALLSRLNGPGLRIIQNILNKESFTIGSTAWDSIVDAETDSIARSDCTARMLFDGIQSYKERWRLIEEARESIHMQTFFFASDSTGWQTANALCRASKRGIKVRLICDRKALLFSSKKIFNYLQSNNIEFRGYSLINRLRNINSCWHEKYFIVDGRSAIVGGMNIGDEYSSGGTNATRVRNWTGRYCLPWRDTDILIGGSVVTDAQKAFMKNWRTLGGTFSSSEEERLLTYPQPALSAGRSKIRIVQHRPIEDKDGHTLAIYLQAIRCAQQSILIENFCVVPPRALKAALIEAAHRGIRIIVLTNSCDTVDLKILNHASRFHYRDLINAGITIFEHQHSTVHSKVTTIDGRISLVGSLNLNGRSDGLDSENLVLVHNQNIARQNEQRFLSGLNEAKEITRIDLGMQRPLTRIKQWAISHLAWTF